MAGARLSIRCGLRVILKWRTEDYHFRRFARFSKQIFDALLGSEANGACVQEVCTHN